MEAWLGFKWVPDVELEGKGFAFAHPPVSESAYLIVTLRSCAPHYPHLVRTHVYVQRWVLAAVEQMKVKVDGNFIFIETRSYLNK